MATSYPGAIDAFGNPGPTTAENASGLEHDVQHANANDAIEAIETELGTNPSGAYATVALAIANAKPKETPWTPYGTPTYADEFDSAELDSGWVRVDPTGKSSYVTWTQANGVLSHYHSTGTDAAQELHALLRPVGSAFAPGDAIVTRVTYMVPWTTNYAMGTLILTDGTTYGAGVQVYNLDYCDTTSGGMVTSIRNGTLFTSNTSTVDSVRIISPNQVWTRLVMTATSTWRHDVSSDGISWRTGTTTLTQALTPTHMGLLTSNWGQSTAFTATYDCFRRYSGVS